MKPKLITVYSSEMEDSAILAVACPYCKANPGRPCRAALNWTSWYYTRFHAARKKLAKERSAE